MSLSLSCNILCTLKMFQRISFRNHSFQDNVVSDVLLNGCIRWYFGRPFVCNLVRVSGKLKSSGKSLISSTSTSLFGNEREREDFRPRTNLEFWKFENWLWLDTKRSWNRNLFEETVWNELAFLSFLSVFVSVWSQSYKLSLR